MNSSNLRANKKAIILGSSKGIGNAFHKAAKSEGYHTEILNSKEIDTSDQNSVKSFIDKNMDKEIDLFIFNTGGLPPLQIDKNLKYFKKDFEVALQSYFWSFYELVSNLNLNEKATIIYLSSHVVTNIEPRLMASSVARSSSEKFLENLSGLKEFKFRKCLSIRFGPVMTDRLLNLMKSSGTNERELSLKLGLERLANTNDILSLAKLLISSNSLFGSGTYNFDSGIKLLKSLNSL